MLRMNAAERGVKGHLPDGDTHASGALIAETQDAFAIADHDAFHTVIAGMTQDLIDAIFIRIAEKQASWLSPYLAEALATLTHGWRVHQREHLFDIAHQERIEQRLVSILQVAEKAVFVEGVRLLRGRPASGAQSVPQEFLHAAAINRAGQMRRVRDRRRRFPYSAAEN